MFKQLSAYTSFAFTAGWSVVSLIGYFQLGWNLGQAIVFINLGFFSLFLNYYLLFIWMYFRDQIVLTYSGKKKNPDLGTLALSIVQTFGFIGNLFLMTCLLAIVSIIFFFFWCFFFGEGFVFCLFFFFSLFYKKKKKKINFLQKNPPKQPPHDCEQTS